MNEKQYKDYWDSINRNICLVCNGSGYHAHCHYSKCNGSICLKCLGSGNRFQNQFKAKFVE